MTMIRIPSLLRALSSILLIAACTIAVAQTNDAAPATTPELAVAVGDIAVRAGNDEQFADAVQRRAQATISADAFDQRLKTLIASHDRLRKALRAVQVDALPIRRLESLERHWRFLSRDLDRWHKELQAAIKPLSADAEQLAARRRIWDATLAAQAGDETPWTARARQVVAKLDAAERTLAKPGAALLKLSQSAVAVDDDIAAGLEQAQQQIRRRDRDLLRLDAPPLWTEAGWRDRAWPSRSRSPRITTTASPAPAMR